MASSVIVKILLAALAASTVQALPQAPRAAQAPNNDDLIKDLKVEPTAVKRFQKLLSKDDGTLLTGDDLNAKIVFDFNAKATAAEGAKGGKTAAANIDTFPILTDLGISTTVAFLEPCGMNTPHIHPRATEFLTVTEGALDFGFVLENTFAKEVAGHLEKYQGTVFPMGSIHYQFNNNCDKATFIATLDNEDPGTSTIAPNFFGLNPEVVNVTLGYPQSIDGSNIEQFRSRIPVNLAQAVDTCLKKCDGKY